MYSSTRRFANCKLRGQTIRVKDVVKDADEEDAEFDEQWHVERVCKAIDGVRRRGAGEIAVHATTESRPLIRGKRKNEIASFRGLKSQKLAISNAVLPGK